MTTFKDYKFTQSEVSAIAVDTNSGEFLWIAYTLKAGTCLLRKVAAHDLTQVYFSISLPVLAINDMKLLGTKLFVAISHATLGAYVITVTNPLSSQTTITLSSMGIVESPIAIGIGATKTYFLTPGVLSGENARLILFNSSGTYNSTVDLTESALVVLNAVSLTVDASENIWVVTSADPAELYRVFFSGTWQLEETILT